MRSSGLQDMSVTQACLSERALRSCEAPPMRAPGDLAMMPLGDRFALRVDHAARSRCEQEDR